jgi:hypothetical protein
MVMAGIKNMKIHGAHVNMASNDACPTSSTFPSPGKTQSNNPSNSKNTATTTYPIRVLKKPRSSLRNNEIIVSVRR